MGVNELDEEAFASSLYGSWSARTPDDVAAPGLRDKDQADFAAALPYLDDSRRAWLRDALLKTLRDHPWIDALRA